MTCLLSRDKHLYQVWLQTTGKQAGQQIADADATAPPLAINARAQAGCCRTGQGVRLRLPGRSQHLCSKGCKLCPHAFSALGQDLPPYPLSPPAEAEPWPCGFRSAPSLPVKLPLPCLACHTQTIWKDGTPRHEWKGEDLSQGVFCTWRVTVYILAWENECTALVIWTIRKKNKF